MSNTLLEVQLLNIRD